MTKNISEEELLLRKRARRRLLGAVTLVIAAIILLPMIFDEPKEEQYEIDIHIPSENSMSDFTSLTSPSENPPVAGSYHEEVIIEPFPIESLNNQELSDTVAEHGRIPVPKAKPQPNRIETETLVRKKDIAPTIDNKSITNGFVVQLGAFSDHSKAKQQQQNLVAHGINAYTEKLKIDNNEITRVRIGPFPTRKAAEDELGKLKQHGLNGVVTIR